MIFRFACLLVAFALLTHLADGQTIIQNSGVGLSNPNNDEIYRFDLLQDLVTNDPTSMYFSIASSDDGLSSIDLLFDRINLDEGSDWYLVQPGEELSRSSTVAGLNNLWVSILDSTPVEPNNIVLSHPTFDPNNSLPAGQSEIYLGFATNETGTLGIPGTIAERNVFGWLRLSISGWAPTELEGLSPEAIAALLSLPPATLELALGGSILEQDPASFTLAIEESVIVYGSEGIIVGTTTTIPEPSAGFLWVAGAAFVSCRRRRRAIG